MSCLIKFEGLSGVEKNNCHRTVQVREVYFNHFFVLSCLFLSVVLYIIIQCQRMPCHMLYGQDNGFIPRAIVSVKVVSHSSAIFKLCHRVIKSDQTIK